MNKILIFLKTMQIVKNWNVIFCVYFGIYKKEFFSLYLKNGLKIKLRTRSTDLQAFVNVWIINEYRIKEFEILENDVIIDIGGHIGLFALYASIMSPNGKIISIEPYPPNFLLLKENITNNNLNNIIFINKAVTDANKNIELFIDTCDDAAHSIYSNGKNSIRIDGITLEEIIIKNKISKCDMLKMDCEGAEFEIIRTLSDNDLLRIEKLCLEYHLKENNSTHLDELKNRLEKMNYHVNIKPTNNFLGMLYAKKQKL